MSRASGLLLRCRGCPLESKQSFSIGIVGARGYVGDELIRLVAQHPRFELIFAASRSQAGEPIPSIPEKRFIESDPSNIAAQGVDAVLLAVPDGAAKAYVDAIEGAVIVDMSSDHRFDDGWVYGLNEHNEQALRGARRISNPGCYATAVQLAIRPLLDSLEGMPHAFGVSGYSGAGTFPSPQNDLQLLAHGVTPYKLVGHTHEREITRHLGLPVRFSPHVAPYFRGITTTVQARVAEPISISGIQQLYETAYAGSNLIELLGGQMPRVQEIAGSPNAQIGGITLSHDGKDIAVVCTIDNLLKGAASQAIQNLNSAFGMASEHGLQSEVLA